MRRRQFQCTGVPTIQNHRGDQRGQTEIWRCQLQKFLELEGKVLGAELIRLKQVDAQVHPKLVGTDHCLKFPHDSQFWFDQHKKYKTTAVTQKSQVVENVDLTKDSLAAFDEWFESELGSTPKYVPGEPGGDNPGADTPPADGHASKDEIEKQIKIAATGRRSWESKMPEFESTLELSNTNDNTRGTKFETDLKNHIAVAVAAAKELSTMLVKNKTSGGKLTNGDIEVIKANAMDIGVSLKEGQKLSTRLKSWFD